jgi:hypothetical protein
MVIALINSAAGQSGGPDRVGTAREALAAAGLDVDVRAVPGP